nr:MFS transporter [Candidatus Sigynarchaeota archaeon]
MKSDPVAKDYRPRIARWVLALCILTIGSMAFNEIESNWFVSYYKYIVKLDFLIIGIIRAIAAIVGVTFILIFGTISDNLRTKKGRRVPLILTGALLTALLLLLVGTSIDATWIFLFGAFLVPVTISVFRGGKALSVDLIPTEKRGRVNTLINLMSNVGSMIVWIPALILFPGQTIFPREIHVDFFVLGAVALSTAGLIVAVLVKEPEVIEPPRRWTDDLKKLFDRHEFARNKDFVEIFVPMIFMVAADSTFTPYLLSLLESTFSGFGLTEMLVAVPIVGGCVGVGFLVLGRGVDKVGRKKICLIGITIAPIGGLIIAFSGANYALLIAGFSVLMPFFLGAVVATDSWVQDILPKEARGRFAGIMNVGSAIGSALGSLLSGAIANYFGILGIFIATSVIFWASIPFFMRVPETLKKKEQVPLPSPESTNQ